MGSAALKIHSHHWHHTTGIQKSTATQVVYTPRVLAERFGVRRESIYAAIRRPYDKLPYHQKESGGEILLVEKDFMGWVSQHRPHWADQGACPTRTYAVGYNGKR